MHEISAWLSNLYRWHAVVDALARKLADSAMSVEKLERRREQSKTTSSLASLHAVFEQPVVVFPSGLTSPNVLIARLGRLTLRSDNSESTSPFNLVQLIIARASLAAFDIEAGVPRVRGTSEVVQAMLVLAHYLRLIPSVSEDCILEDISANLTVGTPRSSFSAFMSCFTCFSQDFVWNSIEVAYYKFDSFPKTLSLF